MAGADKPRLRGHALRWMSVTRAQCECREYFRIEDAAGQTSANLYNELMDKHSAHLAEIRGQEP